MVDASAAALASLAERYAAFGRHEFPLHAFLAGQSGDDPTMFREAPADFARRADEAARMLGELAGIPAEGLERQDRITHRLLQRELCDLVQVHRTRSHLRPWLLPGGPEFNTIFFANASQAGDAASARVYADRLATLSVYFRDVLACLSKGAAQGIQQPRVVLQAALANLRAATRGAVDELPWLGPFRRSPAAAHPAVQREAQRARALLQAEVLPALHALADGIEQALLPQARDTIACTDAPGGDDFYAFWVRHFTTLPLTPEAIHALGLEQVARLEAESAEVAAQAGFGGDVPRYRRFLRDDPGFYSPSAEALLAQVQALAKRIDGLIPSVIGHLPRTTYTVRSIPVAAAEKLPLAYAQPNPGDGSAPGVFWISSLTERVPSYLHVSLALHEAWPGHLMHIALMQEMTTLPAFRRASFTKYTACLEGWAMYCERLGEDLGLYETPHQRLGRLDMEMWRACRLVVDTGIHVRGWGREHAVAYMAERLTLTREAIEAEVDRYIAMPAQALGYLPGGLKFAELRRRAQSQLGERFSLRAFHDQLMAAGAVTLPVLEEVVDDWLARHAA
ncbi:MAG: DUF885 domain-containing protein [Burkholderiaceae bacterium]|jgi:uncharacterized protein (DUF885 family)|nr:DUF885 domain-containing protein [Burkholderiaceae bacterium]